MMILHSEISDVLLRSLIAGGGIRFGGNRLLKIYGTLRCKSGRSMKKSNRVFFDSEAAAVAGGYRPCGHCMRIVYKKWKDELI